jgi:hypothetical protein
MINTKFTGIGYDSPHAIVCSTSNRRISHSVSRPHFIDELATVGVLLVWFSASSYVATFCTFLGQFIRLRENSSVGGSVNFTSTGRSAKRTESIEM